MVKLARKHDPDGIRTLGVVTKCDDAANAEASDVVQKAFALLGTNVLNPQNLPCLSILMVKMCKRSGSTQFDGIGVVHTSHAHM